MVGIKHESMRKGQTSHKKEHNTRMCFPLKPVFTRDKGGLPNFMDEPTAGLDVITRNEVLDIIRIYMEEEMRTVIISSHISSDLENLCDDIYMINDGKIILHEDMYKLLDLYGVIKANEEQYENLKSDTNYKNIILCCEKEKYGYKCITNDRKYIVDNYPEIVIEKGNIDELIMVLVKGEKI